jgi:hypothetical protein
MKADASDGEARLQSLKQAGNGFWTALSAALGESRKAFDRANRPHGTHSSALVRRKPEAVAGPDRYR